MIINIVILTKLFPDNYRQYYGRLVYNLAYELNNCEDINLIVLRPIPYIPKFLGLFGNRLKTYAKHPKYYDESGLRIFYPRYFKFPGSFSYFENLFIKKAAGKILKQNFPVIDVIYSHWVYPDAVAGYDIAKKNNAKMIIHFHASNPVGFARNTRIKRLVSNVLKNSDVTIFVSNGIKEQAMKIYEVNNPVVIHNGIDDIFLSDSNKLDIRKKLKLNESEKVLLSVAYLKPAKGIDTAIKAFSKLSSKYLHYYIVGWGGELKKLQKMASNLGVPDRIHFVGKKSQDEVKLWMQAADVLIQPSRIESFGQIFVESLMCGTPVIGTYVGGIPEIVRDNYNGFLINPDSPDELVDAINKALSRSWDKKLLIDSVGDFTLKKMTDEVASLIAQLITKSSNWKKKKKY